jgi:acetolactate decarboxylase
MDISRKKSRLTRSTLYQVSIANALVEGIYDGAVRVSTLRKHGDLGLGTFENLDGEMVILDGHFFQVRSDSSVREAGDDILSPFAVVTHFKSDLTVDLELCPDLSSLFAQFDRLRAFIFISNYITGIAIVKQHTHPCYRSRRKCWFRRARYR